ncbi:hypothetical protein LAUMK191_03823 [Mycobacterium attenuatum]|uniref:Cytochrome P450 n=1 Tax=Mycobacterium attenuatum TaxID=2341086 RepID=A0A498Q9K9_9MYCO|nr:hypothetical protein LAUMK136_03849 [Mycobacterium attenuatum]VBA57041.1 hypothetical protein LAUMK191_03823 [Mycobacterium attenuatum]
MPWVEVPDYRSFWAITKHADIMDIERDNMLFTNWPRPVPATRQGDELQAAAGLRTLIHLDDPQHRVVRGLVPAKSHARVEGSHRPVGQGLC